MPAKAGIQNLSLTGSPLEFTPDLIGGGDERQMLSAIVR
jgi:hypothetical protein